MTKNQSLGKLFWVVITVRRPHTLIWPASFALLLKRDATGSLYNAGCNGLPRSCLIDTDKKKAIERKGRRRIRKI